MAQRTERAILNRLIERCRDAERGFRAAAEQVHDPEKKRLFLRLAEQRHEFAADLLPHAQRLGGAADVDGTGIAALHRAWMQVKARLAPNPEHAVLAEAARGEGFAVAAYDEAVHDLLPPDARDLIESQDLGIRIARRLVSEMAGD
jgi:uncharacterized protein (TIGR02284 family)